MIIEIPNENSTIKWKYKDTDDWTIAEVSDLIKAYEEQRPQGEWIADKNRTYSENEDTWECSVCHEPFTLIEGTPEENLYYYCPKCGARLIADGGEK